MLRVRRIDGCVINTPSCLTNEISMVVNYQNLILYARNTNELFRYDQNHNKLHKAPETPFIKEVAGGIRKIHA